MDMIRVAELVAVVGAVFFLLGFFAGRLSVRLRMYQLEDRLDNMSRANEQLLHDLRQADARNEGDWWKGNGDA